MLFDEWFNHPQRCWSVQTSIQGMSLVLNGYNALYLYSVSEKKSVLRSAWFLFYGDVWLFDVVCTKCNGTHTVYHLFFEGVLCVCSKLTGTGCLVSMIAHTYTYMCIAHTHMFLKNICFVHIRMPPHTACVLLHIYHERVFQGMCIYIYTQYLYIYTVYIFCK